MSIVATNDPADKIIQTLVDDYFDICRERALHPVCPKYLAAYSIKVLDQRLFGVAEAIDYINNIIIDYFGICGPETYYPIYTIGVVESALAKLRSWVPSKYSDSTDSEGY